MSQYQTDFSADNTIADDTASYFANRAIVPSEKEKNFSLRELFEGVFSKLHPLFSIDCAALILYDKALSHITRAYLSETEGGRISCVETIADPVSLSLITREISGFDFPVLKSRQNWIDDFGENHCLNNHPTDYHFHCYIPIENNGQILGTFELHNHNRELSADGLTFCCNIADFLAGLLAILEQKSKNHHFATEPMVENHFTDRQSADAFTQLLDKLTSAQQKIEHQQQEIVDFQNKMAAFIVDEIAPENTNSFPGIIGNSIEMQQVYQLLNRISPSETTVLILGETGTGKEVIAKAIHEASGRKEKTMIKVNCAAIPPNLIESELFGHERGSFTGATERRIGKFEQAHKGTIFLDEVGELPLDLQVKLLRVLQEKEIELVGGKTTIATDVRVISATNRDLLAEVEAGRFRRDLFYRLNVFPVSLPPLRNRKTDIPLLAAHFLQKFAEKSNRNLTGFSKKAIASLAGYHWPGNVRELEHLVEREVVLATAPVIKEVELPASSVTSVSLGVDSVKTIFENERDHIFSVLALCNGKISGPNGAAKLLGVPATTLNSKIKKLGLSKKHVL